MRTRSALQAALGSAARWRSLPRVGRPETLRAPYLSSWASSCRHGAYEPEPWPAAAPTLPNATSTARLDPADESDRRLHGVAESKSRTVWGHRGATPRTPSREALVAARAVGV